MASDVTTGTTTGQSTLPQGKRVATQLILSEYDRELLYMQVTNAHSVAASNAGECGPGVSAAERVKWRETATRLAALRERLR